MKRRVRLKISGRVQGVYYRATAREVALKLGINGFVRNLSDGSVEVVAEGDEEKLKEFINWCWKGPSGARVENVMERWEEFKGDFSSFTIKY